MWHETTPGGGKEENHLDIGTSWEREDPARKWRQQPAGHHLSILTLLQFSRRKAPVWSLDMCICHKGMVDESDDGDFGSERRSYVVVVALSMTSELRV